MLSPVRDAEIFYRFSLRAPWGHLAVAAVIVFILGFLAPKVWRHMTTEWLVSNPTPENLIRATRLEPDRAEYFHLIGRHYLASTDGYDPQKAVDNFRRATELNPAVASYWMDLSRAYEALGNHRKEAEQCIETALLHDPRNPDLEWSHGNTKLLAGNTVEALEAWRDSIEGNPTNIHFAFDRGWRMAQNTEMLLDHLVPPDNASDFKFLEFLISGDRGNPTLVWKRITARRETFDIKFAANYMTWLLKPRTNASVWTANVHTARQVWPDVLRLGSGAGGALESPKNNLVTNGGFENELLNLGFGWRTLDTENVNIVMDYTVFAEGRRALRIDFNNADNVNFEGLRQSFPVEPGHRYLLTSQIKADRISGASAPHVAVIIANHTGEFAKGQDLNQTRSFVEDRVEFTVPRDAAPLAEIMIRRVKGHFGSKVNGSFWIDDVSIADLGPAAGGGR